MYNDIYVDIDKDRIKEIVEESLRILRDYGEILMRKEENIIKNLEDILSTNKIATVFYLDVPTERISDMRLRVDPVKKKVLFRSSCCRDKIVELNHMIKVL